MARNSERDSNIVTLIDSRLFTFEDVARLYDITRQRAHQIWLKAGGKPGIVNDIAPAGYDNLKTFCEKYGYTEGRARIQFASNQLNGIKMRGRLFIAIEEPFLKMCVICGNPIIESNRRVCCSDKCWQKRLKRLHANCGFRRFKKRIGQKITPSIDYIKKGDTK